MPTFGEVRARWNWQAIPGCPGRYVLRGATRTLSVEEIAGETVLVREFQVAGTPDGVLVTQLDGGGLISFRKANGVVVHTLNTPEGLARRLARLEISANDVE
jgi:hypothetical protein